MKTNLKPSEVALSPYEREVVHTVIQDLVSLRKPPQKSGLVPEGDVRLTANIRSDLHLKLKMRAAQELATMGELIEEWIDSWR